MHAQGADPNLHSSKGLTDPPKYQDLLLASAFGSAEAFAVVLALS